MRGRKKLFILAALLSIILIVSVVFSSGLVDISKVLLGGSSGPSPLASSSTPVVSMDPPAVANSSAQAGNVTEFHVNITLVTDLFAWQINMSWNASILNVNNIIAGEFLNVGAAPNYTTSSPAPDGLGFVINVTDNAVGYTAMGESILGADRGVSDNGTLVTIEFLVVGYGSTDLTISTIGILPTTLLDNASVSIPNDKTDGYFRNKYNGDIDGDWDSDYDDWLLFVSSYLKTSGVPGYNIEVDVEPDGDVDYDDFLGFVSGYLKTFPH